MIGTLEVLVIDCPDPNTLADFYAEVLGMRKFSDDPGWAEILGPGAPRPIIAFQRVEGEFTPPQWPGQDVPQQMHLDVKVDDLDVAEEQVLALGATRTGSETPTFRVYLDPAEHPFCLIKPND
jgi:catechol 2,3-dioxygenase-like lactoylglutathione lyase family enzyme